LNLSKVTVTNIRDAAKCLRYFILTKKYNLKPNFKLHTNALLIGNTVHNLIDFFVKDIKQDKPFYNEIEIISKSGVNSQNKILIIKIVKDHFFKIYKPVLNKLMKRSIQNWVILRIWECINEVSRVFSDLIYNAIEKYHNIKYVQNIFRYSERNFEEEIKILDTKIKLTGKLDSLIFDISKNEILIFEFKTGLNEGFPYDIIQIALYSYLLQKQSGINCSVKILYLGQDKVKEIELSPNLVELNLNNAFKIIEDMVKFHDRDEIPPKKQLEHICSFCWLKNKCDTIN